MSCIQLLASARGISHSLPLAVARGSGSSETYGLPWEDFMRFFRCVLVAGLFAGAGLTLGCSKPTTMGMRNYQPGSGPEVQKDLPLKKGNKPMPTDPPDPKAPPVNRQ